MEQSAEETVYTGYLDRRLAGEALSVDAFLEEHPGAPPGLVRRLRGLERELREERGALPYDRLGDFDLLEPLDEGGMGMVFLARQRSLGREVALKLIRPELRASATVPGRFRREAQIAARLRHPGIVTVHAVGEDEGVLFIAMERVAGESLDRILAAELAAGRSLAPDRAIRWAAAVARALSYAHGEGVVHRDVKPANIRITPDGRPVLLDFGIAKEPDIEATSLTRTFAGSPEYAAPEQLTGASLDARSDVYGLGVTLYQCLTGRVPFAGAAMGRIVQRVLGEEVIAPRRLDPAIPRDAEVVVLKALEKDPDRRYPSAEEFADDLEAVLERRPIRARPPSRPRLVARWLRRRPWRAAMMAAAFAGVLAYAGWQARAASERRRAAREAVAEARALVADFRTRRDSYAKKERALVRLQSQLPRRHLGEEDLRRLDELESTLVRMRRGREAAFHSALELLRRAERLNPEVAGPDEVRAALYAERWREARARDDVAAASFFADLVRRHDPGGSHERLVLGPGTLAVSTTPPGAEVHVFARMTVDGLGPRLVPVPVGGGGDPGAPALRVTQARAPLREGDLIVALDGKPVAIETDADAISGRRATVFRDGRREEVAVPDGVVVRKSVAPLFAGPGSLVGRSPCDGIELPFGRYVGLVRRRGFADTRFSFELTDRRRELKADIPLEPRPPGLAGFVRVASLYGKERPFWIQERETTVAEYLAFLDDPAVPAERHRPRNTYTNEVYATRTEAGYRLDEEWRMDWPALGVSREDAVAYARWRTARARDRRLRFTLPTFRQWGRAGGAGTLYPFGDVFRPHWVSSCFARERAAPRPVLSFPWDESPLGVFDMAGSASEWLADWRDESRGLCYLAGGSWALGDPEAFRIHGPNAARPDAARGDFGFRLVAIVEAR